MKKLIPAAFLLISFFSALTAYALPPDPGPGPDPPQMMLQ